MKLKKLAITLPAPICIVASLSLFMTYLNHGIQDDFLWQWGKAFLFSLIIILPVAGLLIMKLSKWVEAQFPNMNPLYRKLLLCGLIALSLESLLSIISTSTKVPFYEANQFLSVWAQTLIKAYPLGYVIAMIMVFVVKPRIQRALAAA
ncbi:DUF2798 domain-containing protein [Vibrio sp.]|uniref:DUF2798 domain-containing protein n=1 Tax=Vibrio sp. TaxID=678 RepID=UPI003AA8E461